MGLAKILVILLSHSGWPRGYFHFNRVPGPVLSIACALTASGIGVRFLTPQFLRIRV
ncbi:MAG: hypothetical protein M2R45_04494 [Verrucomicrobia subdivision 3 bacterium]|nr:hypothetical protein [Limisphaerales bacterium]MCS1412662.1 hypothetical protein [Limisphaerales bacterium]